MEHAILTHFLMFLAHIKTQSKASLASEKLDSRTSIDYLEELATVIDTIQPYQPGRIYFQASLWSAVCEQNVVLSPGTTVRVIGMKNITYIVEPFSLMENDQN